MVHAPGRSLRKETRLRKLTYFVACSIDGFIGDPDGDASFMYAFLDEEFLAYLTTEYPETVATHGRRSLGIDVENKRFDTVIQGRGSYEVGLKEGITSPYSHLREYVARARSPSRPTRTSRSSPTTWSAGCAN